MNNKLMVNGAEISVTTIDDKDYISLTDMLKAKGAKSDYLSGHSESCVGVDKNLDPVFAMPRGSEREAINVAIHDMIEDLKAKELI